jgi:predicted  nucleic acid-binding Zn-ribbon protein
MTLVEIIGNQHLRILALEETISQLQNQNSKLQERIVQLTPKASSQLDSMGKEEPGLNPEAQGLDSVGQ